ncbi:hypothetical protein LTR36_002746 [Oleoguttula mirabilis]|uniref:Alpha/beta hydrolase fold-3 domain-containing protein n=1 Tax=Oleoguttula mirabilis TaxID=1507867 RepID=A0AAV9JKQ1_9PEZI|nr:hypothetical protein LTR36_002746 [Oleoguttula mirabilis]
MAPSKESEALGNLFQMFSEQMPQDNNPFLARIVYDQLTTVASEATEVTYEDVKLPGNYRGPAKWVKPLHASKDHVLLFMHGGGYNFGSLTSHRMLCAHLAKASNCVALMVDYRLTPEFPYPAALDDCVAAYKWLLDQGYKAENIVTIGDSCGGGLATTVPLKAMRDGLPRPGAAVAMSPWTDKVGKDSESMKTNVQNDILSTPEGTAMLAKRYCHGGAKLDDPLISPIYADEAETKKLPPHWISCAGCDLLLNDGTRMAEKLKKAGVEVVLQVHEGQQHVMEFMAGTAPESDQSIKDIGQWVQKTVGSRR